MKATPSIFGRLIIGVIVLALIGLNVLLAHRDLGGFNTPVALGIAGLQAVMLVAVFMRPAATSRWIGLYVFTAVYLVILLIAVMVTDNVGRRHQSSARSWTTNVVVKVTNAVPAAAIAATDAPPAAVTSTSVPPATVSATNAPAAGTAAP